MGIDRNLKDWDLTLQGINLDQTLEGAETAGCLLHHDGSGAPERPVEDTLAVVDNMIVKEMLMKAANLTGRMQMALDAGAKKIVLRSENKWNLADVPDEVLNKIRPVFYADPINAAIRAMGLE